MTLKEKFKKLSRKEKYYLAYNIGMSLIKKKIEAEECAEQMASDFEEIFGHRPTREIKEQVKEFLSL